MANTIPGGLYLDADGVTYRNGKGEVVESAQVKEGKKLLEEEDARIKREYAPAVPQSAQEIAAALQALSQGGSATPAKPPATKAS